MKDNEIIKALECCMNDDCDNCPNGFGNCEHNLAKLSIDLINRQKAEIERLQKQLKEGIDLSDCAVKIFKSVAIKEFLERFSNAIDEKVDDSIKALNPHLYITKEIARDLVKEMTEQ